MKSVSMAAASLRMSMAPDRVLAELNMRDLAELEAVEKLLAISPHNRQLCTSGGDTLNTILAQLPRLEDASRRAIVLRIIRHLGNHRFTVHNTRFFLAAVAQLEAAHSAGSAPAASAALELLQLMGDIFAGASGPAELPAFWDMSVGIMGATGFDLPADRLIHLASKGAFAISCWLRLEQLSASPVAVFGVSDAAGAGLQLQLHRAGSNIARAELLVTEPPRATAASRLLPARLTGGTSRSLEMGAAVVAFECDAVLRCGSWHLLTFSCRRGTLIPLSSSARDEALLCIDGAAAARASGFRYPAISIERASQGHAAVGAPATPRAPASALRGQLGPFVLFDSALSAPEAEACYEAARSGRALFEMPKGVAAWHPLLADRSAGVCIAATADGPWAARPRSESISVIEIVRAKDSAGGMLNILLPLLALRRRSHTCGDAMLAASLRMAALLLRSHPRNQVAARFGTTCLCPDAAPCARARLPCHLTGPAAHVVLAHHAPRRLHVPASPLTPPQAEMLRSEGMVLLGHLLRQLSPTNIGSGAIGALATLTEASREAPELFRQMLDKVILRFDAWRRLEPTVQASLLALVNALAADDEVAAHAVGLPQVRALMPDCLAPLTALHTHTRVYALCAPSCPPPAPPLTALGGAPLRSACWTQLAAISSGLLPQRPGDEAAPQDPTAGPRSRWPCTLSAFLLPHFSRRTA